MVYSLPHRFQDSSMSLCHYMLPWRVRRSHLTVNVVRLQCLPKCSLELRAVVYHTSFRTPKKTEIQHSKNLPGYIGCYSVLEDATSVVCSAKVYQREHNQCFKVGCGQVFQVDSHNFIKRKWAHFRLRNQGLLRGSYFATYRALSNLGIVGRRWRRTSKPKHSKECVSCGVAQSTVCSSHLLSYIGAGIVLKTSSRCWLGITFSDHCHCLPFLSCLKS